MIVPVEPDEDEIPFDTTPVYWCREPTEQDFRAAGYELFRDYDYEGAVPWDSRDLSAWTPSFPDCLSDSDGWRLVWKEFYPVPLESEILDNGDVVDIAVEFVPSALWGRLPPRSL